MAGRRRSVPGVQHSMDPDVVVRTCAKCGGVPQPVTCATCGGTGKVTLLPRGRAARRVRLEMDPDEAKALLEGRPWPQTVVRLAGALDRALSS